MAKRKKKQKKDLKLGEYLKQLRIDQDLTQLDMADTLGISYHSYVKIEQGNYIPKRTTQLQNLADKLDLNIGEIFSMTM